MQIKTIQKTIQKRMNEWLLTITDEELRGKIKNNLLVSGGSIVSLLLKETVNDYDIYIKDMDVLMELTAYYVKQFPVAIEILDGRKRIEYLNLIQYKQGIYKIAVENLKPDQVKLFFTNKEALESIICKQVKYQGSLYPLTSIIRMKKFIKRGWNINAGEILKIMFQISELDLKNPNILEEQLIGVDVAYFAQLIEILRTVSPEKITSSYLNEIIDRVFNTADEDIEANTTLVNDVNEVTF